MNFQGEIVFLSGAITGIAGLHGTQSCCAAAERSGMEATEIILNLCDELGKKGRHREGISLSKV